MPSLTYRAEIDGLRALAVIPVVLFHLGLGLTGGYVGVDIFFVISGFLITSLIRGEVERGTFSLARFWERRIRRILPAAAVTVLVTLVLGAVLLLPADLEDLGRSTLAQALLGANFYFHATAGYFSAPAETKPLLHFWSLAVEEQFYLVFPFVLLAFGQARRQAVVWLVGGISLASFGLSVVGAYRFSDATFYLLPGRMWELGIGALLALTGGRLPLPERARPMAGWLGLAMMIVPVFVYTADTPFPGLAALPPCLGALLVIWATERGAPRVKALLSWRPFVFVGLISYSLYLWHWPVQVYSHYWLTGTSPLAARLLVLTFCFGLAVASWRLVELPFRARRALPGRRAVFGGALASTAALVALGALVAHQQGLPGRMPAEAVQFAAAYEDRPTAEAADVPLAELEEGLLPALTPTLPGAPRVLLWGDSHARVVSPAVAAVCHTHRLSGFLASRGATPGLLNWGDAEARQHNAAVLRWVERHRPEIVILASRWDMTLPEAGAEELLLETVRALTALSVEVWVMRPVPFLGQDVPRALARSVILGREVEQVGIRVEQHQAHTAGANGVIDRVLAATAGSVALDPLPYLTIDGVCVAEIDGEALYYEHHHLTRAGARRLEPLFAGELQRRLAAGSASSAPRLAAAGGTLAERAEQGEQALEGTLAPRPGFRLDDRFSE